MQYDFLKNFPRRMKNVGLYAMLVQNSVQKMTWKQYGFLKPDEQLNLVFAVMLYIMEQSLKEEACTMDDIGAYIDTLNVQHFRKNIGYEECRRLGDFIVNVILSNEGRIMYFDGYDFEQNAYQTMHISYVANRIIYIDQEVKRTSYYLTDDGYNLLLATLEIENNMKLTIHEMIFQLHLEKQSYDKAVDEIKNIFNQLRIQQQKIQEAMARVRRNALNYSVKAYEELLLENLKSIGDTKQRFQKYREVVKSRVREAEEEKINVRKLTEEEEEKLNYLHVLETYLNCAIDEHQKILNSHFDLKALYMKELEELTRMSLIKRFSLRTELYDKILEQPLALESLEYFLRPLFNRDADKIYNLNKAFQLQRPVRKKEEENLEEQLDFDEEKWQEEQERQKKEKLKRYRKSLRFLFEKAAEKGMVTLQEIGKLTETDEESKDRLIPNVEIFKEIMVELIKNREIDVEVLQRERREYIQDRQGEFQLNDMLLELIDEDQIYRDIRKIEILRTEDGSIVTFADVLNENGEKEKHPLFECVRAGVQGGIRDMAYELEQIRLSQEIFYYLLENHELREDDELLMYKAYTEQEQVQSLVKSQGEAAMSSVERYGNVIYLIPKEENNFLGFSKAQMKAVLCKSNATDKDYYLSQFVILTLLVEFFDGQGSSSKAREYIRVGELQNCISERLKEGAERAEETQEREGIAFSNMLEAYEALRSDEKGSRARTTKEGFLHQILTFLQKQGLIEYVEQDEMVKTTKKLDNFMDWNLLNQNNYRRVLRVLGVNGDE